MNTLKIIHGSTRPSRTGLPVSKWIESVAGQHGGFSVELLDLADIDLPLLNEPEHPAKRAYIHDHTKAWSEKIGSADAYIFVTAEYDYFPPAALVNAVQYLSAEWANKPAGIVAYGGISGGLRAAESLRTLLSGVGLVPLSATVPLPIYFQYLDEQKGLQPSDPIIAGATAMVAQLHRYADALKPLRQ